jgi:hypothetical protein
MAIGVLGEYLGRLFTESKQRPHYLIRSIKRHDVPGAAQTSETAQD